MMLLWMTLVAQAATPVAQDAPTIVVTGRRFDDTSKAIADCIARNCPPDEEVRAALAHAENLFVAGDYMQARLTLRKTIGRVDKAKKLYPVAIADAWRADARVAAHMGQADAMRIGQFESVDALKSGLPQGDAQVLVQRIEVADTFAKQGRFDVARNRYFKIAAEAESRGYRPVQGLALLRIAIMDNAFADVEPTIYRQRARESIDRIRATTAPELANFREAAEFIAARSAARSGDMSGIDVIASRYAAKPTHAPMILYNPSFEFTGTKMDPDAGSTTWSPGDFEGQWVDVTFLIGADGKVIDAEVLREAPKLKPFWIPVVLKAISARRYAPLDVPDGLTGLRRVERYTLNAFSAAPTGSRMTTVGGPRLAMMDLTADAPAGKQPNSR